MVKKKLQKSFFNQKYSSVLIKTGTEELFLTLCGKVLHGVDASKKKNNNKTGFCTLVPRVFLPFRQFDWFCGALLLALTIFSFSLIERGDCFALFYDNELKFSLPTEKAQKLLQYSMCSNKGAFVKKMRHLHQASLLCSG